MTDNKITPSQKRASELICEAAKRGALKRVVLSKPEDASVKRAELTVKQISGCEMVQLEVFTMDNKAYHRNIRLGEAVTQIGTTIQGYSQINIICSCGEAEYRKSKSGNDIVIGYDKLQKAISVANPVNVIQSGNNHEKKHILNGSEPFLKLLGVSDSTGRVYDKKQSKFRQINRFLELIRDVEEYLPGESIRICDLCCGKSYLSFAVYYYFSKILGKHVSMTGVDLKPDVIEYCSQTAKQLGYNGLEFVCGDINNYTSEVIPQLVVSLHACDTATDIVFDKALEWRVKVILSTPCCHHELNHTLDCPELAFIAEHSMLRQKLCDAATDALRLKRLESHGYNVSALELIDPEETPKNIMLRAVRNDKFDMSGKRAVELADEYKKAYRFLVRNK